MKLVIKLEWKIRENQLLQTELHWITDLEFGSRTSISESKSSVTIDMNLHGAVVVSGSPFWAILMFNVD